MPTATKLDPAAAALAGLAAKMAEVMEAVGHVPKNGYNDHHRYEYATAADVADTVRRELSARKVAVTVEVTGGPVCDWQAGKQRVLVFPMRGSFICGETGATISVEFAGAGADSGDKALYKAITGGVKYLLLSTFLVPTGDDPEADTRTDRESEQAQPAAAERDGAPRIPRDRAESIVNTAKEAGWDETTFRAQLADVAGHQKVAQLTVDEAEEIEQRIQADVS